MAEPNRPGRKKPSRGNKPIETSDDELWSTPSPPTPTPCLSGKDKDKDIEMEEIGVLFLKQRKKRKVP